MTAPLRRHPVRTTGGSEDPATDANSKSANDFLTKPLIRKLKSSGIEAHEFRRWFAPRFAAWLRQSYRSHVEVSLAFDVSPTTAFYWWKGEHRASGDATALLFLRFPDAQEWFLREWERR